MKVHELLHQPLLEASVTFSEVYSLYDLQDPATGKYYTDIVNVSTDVVLYDIELNSIPVKFGTVGGNFDVNKNNLTSLKGAPRKVGVDVYCSNNQITSLEGIHKIIEEINGKFYLYYNPIKSGGIGLLLIKGLKEIETDIRALDIINKYLGQGKRGLLACQEELIESGYEEFAKL